MEVARLVPSQTSLDKSTIADLEVTARTREGHQVPVSMAWAPLLSDTGRCDGYTIVLRDLSSRKHAETQRTQERLFSDTIIDSLPGVFYLINTDSRFVRWNKNFEEVTGYDSGEMRSMLATDLFEGDDRDLIAERMAEVFTEGESSTEANLYRKDGTSIPYSFTGRRVLLESTPYLVGMGMDVSERKRLEHELIHSQKMQAVGTLAGGIAHDFNNLLTVILGCAEMATSTMPADDAVREDLEQITVAGQSAARLTRQLLQFSRKQIMQPQVVLLPQVIEPLTSMLQRLIGEDIQLEIDFEKDLWPVAVDVASIEQVVMNLVVNARDALPQGGRIAISVSNRQLKPASLQHAQGALPGPYVRLSIQDTGEGISAEVLERLFEPFYTTKEQGHGTGLGLSVVYGIVRQHDGWLQVASDPGQGARFDVYLRRSKHVAESTAESRKLITRLSLEGIRVLLIEDESAVLRFASSALHRRGCVVTAAAGFEDGLATFEAHKGQFDLLFSDVILPDGNGLELARRIRSSRPNLPVLMTSGYAGDRSRVEEIVELGLRFLQKPYRLADLYREVAAAVAARPTQRASKAGNATV